jgi:hypothetical protein
MIPMRNRWRRDGEQKRPPVPRHRWGTSKPRHTPRALKVGLLLSVARNREAGAGSVSRRWHSTQRRPGSIPCHRSIGRRARRASPEAHGQSADSQTAPSAIPECIGSATVSDGNVLVLEPTNTPDEFSRTWSVPLSFSRSTSIGRLPSNSVSRSFA